VAQRGLVVRLDEEVEVIVLDRHVNDPERVLAEHVLERAADGAVRRPTAQPRHALARTQHDVNRMMLRERRPNPMRRIEAPPRLLATRTLACTAPRLRMQIELQLRLARRLPPAPDHHLD
jgi:hypothetical protein